jgi:hypothetical protein
MQAMQAMQAMQSERANGRPRRVAARAKARSRSRITAQCGVVKSIVVECRQVVLEPRRCRVSVT